MFSNADWAEELRSIKWESVNGNDFTQHRVRLLREDCNNDKLGKVCQESNTHMANVLWRFMWQTSPPHVAGFVRPIWAFKFAPTMTAQLDAFSCVDKDRPSR